MIRVLLLVALVGAAAAGTATVLPAPAQAHAQLLRSTPADGAQLSAPPEQVSLTFSDTLDSRNPEFVRVALTGPGEQPVATGAPRVTGATATVDFPAASPAGAYTVSYRVVSADGHPVQGVVRFTLAGATSPSASADATAAPTASTPAVRPAATPSVAASADGDDQPWWPYLVMAVLLVTLVGIGLLLATAPRARRGP